MEVWVLSYIIMALLCLLLFSQPTWQRFIICISFCVEIWLHALLDHAGYLNAANYYLSGGIFTSIVLAGIVIFSKPNKFTDMMVMACAASILLNVYGWIIYESYMKPDSYNIAFYVLYMIVAFIFLQKEGVQDEDRRTDGSQFRLPYFKRYNFNREIHREAHK